MTTKLAAAVETAREKEEEINLCRSLKTSKKALPRQEANSSDLMFKLTPALDSQHKRESEYKQEFTACTNMDN